MIYIIEGEEEVFIRKKINQIIKTSQSEVISFDGNDSSFNINEVFDACVSNTLFSSGSIVLVKDAPFLVKKVDDKYLDRLYEYIDNPVYETELIFYSFENRLNGKLKAYKSILKNAQLITLNSYDYKNFNTYVNQQIIQNDLKINKDAIIELGSICKRNATLLNQNIEVLKNYPGTITLEVVNKLCSASDDNDSFELVNALTNKDISKAILLERKMLKENDSIFSIIGLLSAQLRFLYQLGYLLSIKTNKNDIIDELKCSEYRYNKSLETLRKLNQKQIIKLLSDLSKLDVTCKNDNSIDSNSRFELFILNLLKKENYASN